MTNNTTTSLAIGTILHGEAPLTEGRNLWKSAGSVGVKTKRSMRLKRQVSPMRTDSFACGTQRICANRRDLWA